MYVAIAVWTFGSALFASIDFRLVPDQTPEKVRRRVGEHIANQGFFIVHDAPDTATRQSQEHVVKPEWGWG